MAEEAQLLKRWSDVLPPEVDLSQESTRWFSYGEMHKEWRQRELESVVGREHCMLLACDSKRGQACKRYIACGFDMFWKGYQTTVLRANKSIQYLQRVRAKHKQQHPPDTPYTAEQCATIALAERYACDASYYEMVVPNKPCHLAFDIEYYHNAHNQRPFEELVDTFLSLLSLLFQEYYGLDDMRSRWHETWTDSSNDEKVSRHLIIRLPCQLMMADMLHCGALTRRLACLAIREYGDPIDNPLFVAGPDGSDPDFVASNDSLVAFWDPLIYTRFRALRMVGSSKIGKFRYFFPLVYDTTSSERSCAVQDATHITREFFLTTLVHSPCDHPERTRILYASEPDGRTCFSTTLLPTHRQRRYVLNQQTIGRAGSIPGGSYIHRVNGDVVQRELRTTNDHNLYGVDDPSNLEWMRFTYIERVAYTTLSTTPTIEDQNTKAMTLLLLDVCDALVPLLNLTPESRGSSTGGMHLQQYYRVHCKERVALVQLAHHYCPLSNTTHSSNHMRYLIQLQPYNQLQPRYRAACFKCRASYKDFAPLPFWNEDWRMRLESVEQQELQQYQRPAYKLFGFMASVLWTDTETCSSDDEDGQGEDDE